MREREERERGGFGGRMDELTRMNQNFESGAYGSLAVYEMQPTVIDITAGFYYQPVVIIYITIGLLGNLTVRAFFLTNWQ